MSGNVLDELEAGRPTPLLDLLTLRFHALAVGRDWVPDTFGEDAPVDVTDPGALRRAWMGQLHRAMAENPERMFAIKVGGGLLILAAVLIVAAVAAF